MPPKKNCRDDAFEKARIPDSACEAYRDLRMSRIHTYGLDIFLRRGMLEWALSAASRPARRAVVRGALESSGAGSGEIVAILTNMMEGAGHGA